MKKKISICIEEKMINKLNDELNKGVFRSRSHIVEYALDNFIKNPGGKK